VYTENQPLLTPSSHPLTATPYNINYLPIRHLINTRDTYQLNPQDKHWENMTIDQILHTNGYNAASHFNFSPCKPKPEPPKKWGLFTYTAPETRFVTKIFRHTTVNIAFHTRNTIQQHLSNAPPTHPQTYDSSGIYQLTCPDCSKRYIGQTGRLFSTRFKEHFREYS
jgi:hypothetical protein